jgi:hypothetical protein
LRVVFTELDRFAGIILLIVFARPRGFAFLSVYYFDGGLSRKGNWGWKPPVFSTEADFLLHISTQVDTIIYIKSLAASGGGICFR